MPSRKPPATASATARPATERTSHGEAHRILMDLWTRKQVDAAKAGDETEKAARLREVEALSVAMTALEVLAR